MNSNETFYQKANAFQRLLAFSADLSVMLSFLFVTSLPMAILLMILYRVACMLFYGQTVGMLLMKINLLKKNYEEPDYQAKLLAAAFFLRSDVSFFIDF